MSNQFEFTLGLDLAQASFDAAVAAAGLQADAWRSLPHVHLDHAPDSAAGVAALLAWLAAIVPAGRCRVVVDESTGTLGRRVARALSGAGLGGVAIVNPRRTKAFGDSLGVRDKSDRIDCALLAAYALERKPQPTVLRGAGEEELRELTRLRQQMVAERTAWISRRGEAVSPAARGVINQTIEDLERRIKQLETQIDQCIEHEPVLHRQVTALQNIPGIGKVTARTLTAELGDLRHYSRGQLVALAGMFPKQFGSGTSVQRRPRLAKGGGARLRRVLYMCATCLFHAKGAPRQWVDEQLARGRKPMVVATILMRKLLLVARAVMLAGGHFDPSLLHRKQVNAP